MREYSGRTTCRPRCRQEPAREAREGRSGVSKVVAVKCEEAGLWGKVILACAGPGSEGGKRTWNAVGVDACASWRVALRAREQVQQTCHEERSRSVG